MLSMFLLPINITCLWNLLMIKIIDKSVIIPLLLLLSASGCSTYSLQELRHTKPQGNAFQNALAKLYMDFSDSEEKNYDWQDSWYFADKGLLAIYGKDTAPENLKNWNLPKDELPNLKKARADLMAVLTPEAMAKNPEMAARAQFYFDCWVEQLEENWQKDDIAFCRDNFIQSLAKLGSSDKKTAKKTSGKGKKVDKLVSKAISKKADKSISKKITYKKEKVSEEEPAVISFLLFFETGSNVVTPASEVNIGKAAAPLTSKDNYAVVIIDKSEGRQGNPELSFERTQAVKEKLVAFGVKEAAIYANDKKIDNKVKQKVEIFIND